MKDLAEKISRNLCGDNYKKIPQKISFLIKRKYHEKFLFKVASKESVFTSIWKTNYWGSPESISGPGSTLEQTENIRKELPIIIQKFGIKTIFDAPCGDFNWMKEVVAKTEIHYIGGDIVKGIIEQNLSQTKPNTSFSVFDITSNKFPKADLWICRDVLFHFSYLDILNALKKFADSDVPFLLTTTHKKIIPFKNKDINTGDFRQIDLFAEPFCFNESSVLFRFDDFLEPQLPREMCLFRRDHIVEIIATFEKNIT